jgi:homospermidine synthase
MAWLNQDYPVYGEISGPIVMIGFGSIGRGTLPLIERHFKFDKSRMVVIDPRDTDRELLEQARRALHPGSRHRRQLPRPADALC